MRSAGLACIGLHKIKETHGRLIEDSGYPERGALWEITLPDLPRAGRFLSAQCPRNGEIFEGVPHEIDSVLAAQAWRVGLNPSEFSYPTTRT